MGNAPTPRGLLLRAAIFRWIAFFALLLAGAAAISLVSNVPALLGAPEYSGLVRIGLVLVLVLALSAANQRYTASWFLEKAASLDRPGDMDELLGSRKFLVEALVSELRGHRPHERGRTILIPGSWGSGKSFIVDEVLRRLTDQGGIPGHKVALIHTDVWAESSEPDLHFSLFENLLSQPDVLRKHRWGLRYSPMLGVMLLYRHVLRMLRGQRLQVKEYSVRLDMPQMLWQSRLEVVVARMRMKGYRLIWVLDEIDRATPELVQGALGLMRRALSLRGVTLVMPYVDRQFMFKAFYPAMVVRPDIAATVYGTLYAAVMAHEDSLGSLTKPLGARSPGNGLWRPADILPSGRGLPGEEIELLMGSEPHMSLRRELMDRLARWFETLDSQRRKVILRTAAEKYLDARVFAAPALTEDDVPDFLWCNSCVRGLCSFDTKADLQSPCGPNSRPLREIIVDGVQRVRRSRADRASPTPRALGTCLSMTLGSLRPLLSDDTMKAERPRMLAFAVIVAYDMARLRVLREDDD